MKSRIEEIQSDALSAKTIKSQTKRSRGRISGVCHRLQTVAQAGLCTEGEVKPTSPNLKAALYSKIVCALFNRFILYYFSKIGSKVNPMAEWRSVTAFPTVEELISHLRFSFIAADFHNVAKTLVEREDYMKRKYIELGKTAEAFVKERDLLFLENLKLNDELKRKQIEFDALRKENLEYKDQIKVLNSEKCRVSNNLVLEDELKKKQSEIDALRKLNVGYEEQDAEFWFYTEQFRDRLTRLEKVAKERSR
ncbi:hypothetical protein L1887_29247 [Cichorium endivia]|nr:hypothetical protein L1887_29247 [Cichorium endivia]